MALNRKYSALPDLDTAPDIYETPELTDDNSTVLTTTGRSPSDDGSDDDDDDDDDSSRNGQTGISRSHVHVDQARSRFMGASVDARGVDFSDRVDGKRKSYRTTTKRLSKAKRAAAARGRVVPAKGEKGDTEEAGEEDDEEGEEDEEEEEEDDDDDDTDDDDADSSNLRLERKIARLKREVEEVKDAHRRKRAEAEAMAAALEDADDDATAADLDALSRALDAVSVNRPFVTGAAAAPPASAPEEAATATHAPAVAAPPPHRAAAPAPLAQVADFDRRLALLERCIGVGSSSALLPALGTRTTTTTTTTATTMTATTATEASEALPRAILPTLDVLQRQISTLADASTASLDGISRRVRTLTQEADQLAKARQAARSAQEMMLGGGSSTPRARVGGGGGGGEDAVAAGDGAATDEATAKIHALYGTLPTIERLTPLLPPLLDRLRSLQTLHADAAAAGGLLDALEQRQDETAAEVRQWREGLDRLEAALGAGDATMGRNVEVMEGWVKGLEARLEKLADA